MTSIFDKATRDEIVNRITSLHANSSALWGRMNVGQMIRHCSLCEELYLGRLHIKRSFSGRIFGKMALKSLLKEGKPLARNTPTVSSFIVNEHITGIDAEKRKWIALINEYENYHSDYFVHCFFGKMSKEQLGQLVYKHCDHHLRQFNV